MRPPADKPIELYYWPTPNGWKISIMLEECGLPYVVRPVDISKGEQFAADFLAISPNNRIPAIVDPDGPGGRPISVFESGAILQYLGRKTGKLYPRNERARVAGSPGFGAAKCAAPFIDRRLEDHRIANPQARQIIARAGIVTERVR